MLKERIEILVNDYKDDELVLEMIHDTLELCHDYVKQVNSMETSISILKFKLDPYDYRIRVQELDQQRRFTHNALIISIKALNRFLITEGKDPLFEGNIDDRYEVADWAGQVSNDIFINRKR